MKILGIIPARGGSKGVPGKNIKLLCGKPLLQYTSDIALSSKLLDKVILSSESKEIIDVAQALGVEVPFVRPVALSQDATPTLDVIKHCLQFFAHQGVFYDAVCLLQVTSPFRTSDLLDEAIEIFVSKRTDSLVSVQKVPHEYNPHWVFEVDENEKLKIATGEEKIIARRQELPNTYHRDGSIYLTRSEVILEQNSLYGQSISFIESPKEFYVNIDTLEDWEKAEKMIQKQNLE